MEEYNEKDIRTLQIQVDNLLRTVKFLIMRDKELSDKLKVQFIKGLEDE